ncbi:MAG: RNA polymerase sigma factor [Armatimonadota bacterium]
MDNELARRAQQGDLTAFEELFNRHHKRVYNIALRMLQNESDAADATQEVFVRAFRSINKLVSGEAFVTWLKTVAVNICRDVLRKRGKVKLESLDAPGKYDDGSNAEKEIADWSSDPGKAAMKRSLQDSVQNAISSLKPDYREVVTLFYVDGADVAEISRITGSPEGTVKSRLARARAELKRKLEYIVSDR